MPVILATGRALIDPDMILDAIGARGSVFADLRAGGHGHFVIAASKRAQAPGRVIAVDVSAHAIDALRSRLTEYGHHNVEILHADMESERGLPLKNGEVEVALLANALYMLTSPLTAFQEIHRVVKPGGTLAIINPKESSPFFALAKTRGISEDTARCLFEDNGFVAERRFEAGPHHICLVFRNA
jgi:ubiquinone/menaquinone biosynthesis C-methylase UbiE